MVWSIVVLASLVALASASVVLLLYSGVGAELTLRYLRARLSPETSIVRVEGTLRGPLVLLGVRHETETATITVDTLRLDWRLPQLLRRTLQIDVLELGGMAIEMRTAPAEDVVDETVGTGAPDSLPALRLPIDLTVARGVVRRISVVAPTKTEPIAFDSLVGAARIAGDTLVVDRLGLFGPELVGRVEGTVQSSGSYPVDLIYVWDLVARGIHLAGSGGVKGDAARLDVWQEVTRPLRAELRAVIDSVLTARSIDARVTLSEFDLRDIDSTWVATQFAGVVSAAGRAPDLRAEADLKVVNDLLGTANLRLGVSRMQDTWQLDSAVVAIEGSSSRARGSGNLRFVAGEPTFDGVVEWRELGWPNMEMAQIASDGRVRMTGSMADYRADATMQVRGQRLPRAELRMTARGSRDSLDLQTRAYGLGDELTLVGKVVLRPVVRWWLALDGKALDLASVLPDSSWIGDMDLALRAEGGRPDSTLVGTVELVRVSSLLRGTPVLGSARGKLRPTGFTLDTATVELLGGRLTGAGSIDWKPALSGHLFFAARDIRPAVAFSDSSAWPGAISTRGRLSGMMARDGFEGRIEVDTVYGMLRGEVLGGGLRAEVSRDRRTVHDLTLAWGPLRLEAAGAVGAQIQGHAELLAPDLSVALPGGGGSIRARFDIEGDRSAPKVASSVEAVGLYYSDVRVGRLGASGGLDLAADGLFDWSVECEELAWRDMSADELRLGLTGQRNDHHLDARISKARSDFWLGLRGTLDHDRWSGEIDRLELSDSTAGDWHLRRAAPIEISMSDVLVADSACAVSGEAALCMAGEWHRAGPWSLSVLAEDLPIMRLAALFPPGLGAAGSLEAMVDIAGTGDSALNGRASIAAMSGELSFPLRTGVQHLSYDRGAIDVEIGDGGMLAKVAVALTRTGGLDSTYAQIDGLLEMPEFRALADSVSQQPIQGRLRLAIADVSALEAISQYVVDVTGRADADLSVAGTVAEPAILGEARLSGGGAAVPALGLELSDVVLLGVGEGRAGFRLSGSARSGNGVIRLAGRGSFDAGADSLLRVNISGEQFQVANVPEAHIWISPDLDFAVTREAMAVEGEVRVPRAVVELKEIPAFAVPLSPDLVMVGDTSRAVAPPIDLRARVRLALGDSISFRGFGLSGRPGGSVLAIDEPGQATTATGQLTIDQGTYRAYGQELTIETGRLIYAGGPIDNPGLDVRAVRRARDDVVAGLDVKGTLRSPEVTIFSEPPMMQSEALAYLLLGRPLSELSASEGNQLSNAAVSLGLRGGNVLAQRLARRFGLDEARLETQGSWEQASLYAGKYLSPRLYVSYGFGLFESMSLFRVRYLLSRRWTLQAETGEGTSTEIHYRVERGR